MLSISLLSIAVNGFCQIQKTDTIYLQPVEVSAISVTDKNPFAKTNFTKEEIKQNNIGQDVPFILNSTPSVVVNSDAGNGIGYTGIRIRGTDPTRINVTLNGIPYNDAESLGTYFVDIPDIASSANSIQIQRGVGTSANGAGSFGGSINISTNQLLAKQQIELNSSVGSFESFKNTLLFNSGIVHKHFAVDARMSNIRSEGYIDRAATRLSSYFLSGVYFDAKNIFRVNIFTGKEKTYQAYYGVNATIIDSSRTYNIAGTEKPDKPYENQIDNYTQTHYQSFFNHQFNQYWHSNVALFFTRGKGYYEEYKANQFLINYNALISDPTLNTNLVRRLWLDNYFYGCIYSLQYNKKNTQLLLGGGYNIYEGNHYGEIIWNKEKVSIPDNFRYYDKYAIKKDFSVYTKFTQQLNVNFQTFLDLQVRHILYKNDGYADNSTLSVYKNYTFFNPKFGITYLKGNYKIYASYSRASKEPNRDDFNVNAYSQPAPEHLNDIETGVEYKNSKLNIGANFYAMIYKNQLVLEGNINDVGAYTRVNIPQSYRVGIEFFGKAYLNKNINIESNITCSKNKVKNFTEKIDNYDDYTVLKNIYKESDISFSPNVIGSFIANILPFKNASISCISKYVGHQYLDNTSNENRALNAYFTQNVRLSYFVQGKQLKRIDFYILANNIFSKKYNSNGYSFSYISSGAINTEKYFFPMAAINFMGGVNISF